MAWRFLRKKAHKGILNDFFSPMTNTYMKRDWAHQGAYAAGLFAAGLFAAGQADGGPRRVRGQTMKGVLQAGGPPLEIWIETIKEGKVWVRRLDTRGDRFSEHHGRVEPLSLCREGLQSRVPGEKTSAGSKEQMWTSETIACLGSCWDIR